MMLFYKISQKLAKHKKLTLYVNLKQLDKESKQKRNTLKQASYTFIKYQTIN